ncbi:regucalcin-like [Belonocnema kinseyi]|uniref:regucalcin-like n=1 Tax=Belonocnema kinseyi TaxID=2817044 RepID=UPI00143D42CB|nr:regucalcin-like [Belonocnema kinseyi]
MSSPFLYPLISPSSSLNPSLNCVLWTVRSGLSVVVWTVNTHGFKFGSVGSLNHIPYCVKHIKEVTSSSGFAFGAPKLYFVDAGRNYDVLSYSFHKQTGRTGQLPVVAYNWAKEGRTGTPRRLTIDRHGNLWVPLYQGGGVIQVNTDTKEIIQFIPIPAHRVSACTFGGPEFDILFVSTMWYGHLNEQGQRVKYDEGGSIFAVKGLEVQGWPPGQYNLKISRVIDEEFVPLSIRFQ